MVNLFLLFFQRRKSSAPVCMRAGERVHACVRGGGGDLEAQSAGGLPRDVMKEGAHAF